MPRRPNVAHPEFRHPAGFKPLVLIMSFHAFVLLIVRVTLSAGLFAATAFAVFPTPTNHPETPPSPLVTPAEAVQMMHLPPGFKATLFAGEPDVQNPIAMCWDERGRLWVAENYTYSDQKERYDLALRDRIVIFEDTDNDGRADKRTVFADDLQILTSIERGFGGVYVMCPPNLLFIPTENDRPSGPPQVLLDGFNATAGLRHTIANGLKWGPDGWLYGRVGITATNWVGTPGTPLDQRQPTAGGIWRYHPVTKRYEPVSHGTTNPWGSDWNAEGELFFINTVIGHLWHSIPGAHFKRMSGEDPYPHIYDLIDQHADHYHWDTGKKWNETRDGAGLTGPLGGGHAHVGLMIYQGTNFPPEYRGKVFTTNIHGHRINVDRLERVGSGYVGKHEPDFMKTDDVWFRAVEIQAGPDGGVYVLDWSDTGECHENDGVHRTSGRIYKITYGEATRPPETDLTAQSDAALVQLQLSPNEWLVRMARWELRERARRQGGLPQLAALLGQQFQTTTVTSQKLNAWWTLGQIAEFAPATSTAERAALASLEQAMLASTDEYLQRWVTPQAVARGQNDLEATHPYVRLARASLLPTLPVDQRVRLAARLLAHGEDATDHNLPLMYWYGLRDLPPAELVKLVEPCRIPLVRQFIARRITEEMDRAPAELNALLTLATASADEGMPTDVVRGMTEALKGWSKATKPAAWDALVARLHAATDPAVTQAVRDLEVLFGSGRALDEVRAIALKPTEPMPHRQAALRTLIEARPPDLRKICETLLNVGPLSVLAMQGLATFDDPALAEKIVARYPRLAPTEQPAAIAVLASRPSFARVLLARLAPSATAGGIPRRDITPVVARQIRSFNDADLTARLTEVWGEARESSADKQKLIAELKGKLTPEFIARGNLSQGRAVFAQTCATCHKLYGEGSTLGPDLTGSGRHDVGYLIENIADPSAVVAADYNMAVITLKDGRVLNGAITARTERTLTVKMMEQETTVDRGEIARQEQLPVSLMPEGLLTALSDDQLASLIAYLMSNGQVPLPK